jgi:hypothetical protein
MDWRYGVFTPSEIFVEPGQVQRLQADGPRFAPARPVKYHVRWRSVARQRLWHAAVLGHEAKVISRGTPHLRSQWVSPREIDGAEVLEPVARSISRGEHDLSGVGLHPIGKAQPIA